MKMHNPVFIAGVSYVVVKSFRFNSDQAVNGPFATELGAIKYRNKWMISDNESIPEGESDAETIDTKDAHYSVVRLISPNLD